MVVPEKANYCVTLQKISGQYNFVALAGKVTNLDTSIFYPQRSSIITSELEYCVKHVRVHCVTYMKDPALAAVTWTGAHTHTRAHPETHRNVWMFFPGSKCGFSHTTFFLGLLCPDWPSWNSVPGRPILTCTKVSTADTARRQNTHTGTHESSLIHT